jgi:hypothetical protein
LRTRPRAVNLREGTITSFPQLTRSTFFDMNASIPLLALTLVVGSGLDQVQSSRSEPALPDPQLLAQTKTDFIHLLWTKDGHQILVSNKSTGVMKRVLVTDIRTIRSVRLKYDVSRLVGVLEQGKSLFFLVGRITVPDEHKVDWFLKKNHERVRYEVLELPLVSGLHLRPHQVGAAPDRLEQSGSNHMQAVVPGKLRGHLSVRDGELQAFGKALKRE